MAVLDSSPKLSIIVPVYNVEKFLKQCVNSILRQSYENFELILVDDGSQDQSGEICDEFRMIDDRVIVIHKKNEGQSIARNVGIEIAHGEYVCFIDSDDWIHNQYLEVLYSNARKMAADIVQCNYYYAYETFYLTEKKTYCTCENEIITYTTDEAIYQLIQHKDIKNFLWGKIIRVDLVKSNLLPNIATFEDLYWFPKLIQSCNKYVIVNKTLYYYRQHESSLTHEYNNTSLLLLRGLEERIQFVNEYYPQFSEMMYYQYFLQLTSLYYYSVNNKFMTKEYNEYKLYALNKFRCHFDKVLKKKSLFNYLKYLLLRNSDMALVILIKMESIYSRLSTSKSMLKINL